MKNLIYLNLVFILIHFSSKAQLVDITLEGSTLFSYSDVNIRFNSEDTSNIGVIDFSVLTENDQPTQVNAQVNWGDGTITNHMGLITSGASEYSTWDIPMIHTYDSINHGYRNIEIELTNAIVPGDSLVYQNTFLICQTDLNILLDLYSSDWSCFVPTGQSVFTYLIQSISGDTIYPLNTNSIINYGILDSGEYTLYIEDWWLDQNSYELDVIYGNTFNFYSYGAGSVITSMISTYVNCIDENNIDTCSNVGVYIMSVDNDYFQNFTFDMSLNWLNYNSQESLGNYSVTYSFPDGVTIDESSIDIPNYQIYNDSIVWEFNNDTLNFQSDTITLNIPGEIEDGTYHNYTLSIIHEDKDCDSTNNNDQFVAVIGASYDPNDKQSNQPYYLNPEVQEEIRYKIRFQNTGTAPAQDIYIIDTLSEHLDWSTFRFESSSHDVAVIDLGDGVMKFNYPQIWLPDSLSNEPESHGYIIYSIKEKEAIGLGDEIRNTAHIFFDHNQAIVTNTTINVNEITQSIESFEDNWLSVYPNPCANTLHINCKGDIGRYRILTLDGREVTSSIIMANSLDVSFLSKGVYLIEISSERATSTRKFIKE